MKCPFCNIEHNRRKWCSTECKMEAYKAGKRAITLDRKAITPCDQCSNMIMHSKSIRFCSKHCKIEWHKNQLREESANQRLQVILKCQVCNKEFSPEKTLRQTKYCSARCRNLFPKKCYKALQTCYSYLGEKKQDHAHKLLGYSPRQLQEHIQSHPNWPLVKDSDWHLDHIFPIVAFLNAGIKDIALICCLDNLQPLAGKANMQKHDSCDPVIFESWLKTQEGRPY